LEHKPKILPKTLTKRTIWRREKGGYVWMKRVMQVIPYLSKELRVT